MSKRIQHLLRILVPLGTFCSLIVSGASVQKRVDVLIYGATPAGIAAALSASRTGNADGNRLSVALVEPSRLVGGMTSPGGIGMRDFGHISPCCAIIEWASLNAQYYGSPEPVWQPDNYVGQHSYRALLRDALGLELVLGQVLQEGPQAVNKSRTTISSITTVSTIGGADGSTQWLASYFIDASYEGDIVRFTGDISYTWGREAASQYNEDLAGVLKPAPHFLAEVEATWKNGSLIKYVQPAFVLGALGSADKGVMAFSYRACVTQNLTNRIPFHEVAPNDYDARDFELMRRYLKALEAKGSVPGFSTIFGVYPYRNFPREKHDLCDANTFPVTSDAADLQMRYINGSYAERRKVAAEVKYYVQGTLFFLATDPSVPASTQRSVNTYGYCADEWIDNGHFPYQMYIREGIRIVGDKVFTENDWQAAKVDYSIGLGSWGLDIHVVHRAAMPSPRNLSKLIVVDEGYTFPDTGAHKYELPYSLIMPQRAQCTNLAVVVCLSSTHVTWSGLREEPTMWQFGMAAGTAAAMLIRQRAKSPETYRHGDAIPFQDVPMGQLQALLLSQGAVLHVSPVAGKTLFI